MTAKTWGIRFEYDEANDIIFVYPAGYIATSAEAAEFQQSCSDYYGSFGRKMDAVVNLEMLNMERGAVSEADANQKARADIAKKFIRYIVLVSDSLATIAKTNQRIAKDGIWYHAATDMEQAIALIKRLRKERAPASA